MSSMTEEEIEALMSGTVTDSIETDVKTEGETSKEEDIDDILAGIDGVLDDAPVETEQEVKQDDILVDLDNGASFEPEEDIDDILASIDGVIDDGSAQDIAESEEDIDDILASIDGISEHEKESSSDSMEHSTPMEDINSKIDNGVYPLPAQKEHKVVSQLNEVAEDSEEKASQMFDILSYILDQNNLKKEKALQINSSIESQKKLLETLAKKFPNIELFEQHLQELQEVQSSLSEINDIISDENHNLFNAIELMQFHDINRQKIERVMSVIKKLSHYLNGLFEDDSAKSDVQVAKHISGDSSEVVTEDDLDNLITEFSEG